MTLPSGKRWWLAVALAAATVLMAPGLFDRVRIESFGQVYDMAVPALEVDRIIEDGVPPDDAYRRLAEAGVSSIAMEMLTVGDLEDDGLVAVMSRAELLSQLSFAGIDGAGVPEGDGWFVVLLDGDPSLADALSGGDPPRTVTAFEVDGQTVLHVQGAADVRTVVVGYDTDHAADLSGRGFGLIARVPDTVDGDPDITADKLAALNEGYGVDRVLFTGSQAPYVDDPEAKDRLIERLAADGYSVMLIELLEQEGTASYVEGVGSGIRLHSIDMEAEDIEAADAVDRAARAVRERNIRTVFLRPHADLSAEGRLQELVAVAAGTRDRLAGTFELGPSEPFPPLEASPFLVAGAALASLSIAIASGALVAPWLALAMGLGTAALIAGWVAGVGIAGDLLRLGIAVLASALAVFIARPRPRVGPATIEYVAAAAVVFAGGLAITALGYEDRFLVGSTDFWGVKALLVAPLALTGLVALYRSFGNPRPSDVPRIARMPVELWMGVVLGIAGAALFYLLIRSGNTGAAADWELTLRQTLEDVLLVRPRTKEFLIGFPALIIGIVVTARTPHGWWLYAVASIGTASAIDTFAHFHTPLAISLLRTAYAVAFGYLLGVAVVLVARWAWPRSRDFVARRRG